MRSHQLFKLLIPGACLALAAACGEPEEAEGADPLLVETEAAGDDCPDGGTIVTFGTDTDGDGQLSEDEIDDTVTICDGADGADGADGTDGTDGTDGADGLCADREFVSIDVSIEEVDHYRVAQSYTVSIATDASADDLNVVVAGSAELMELADGGDGVEGTFEFTRADVQELTFVASDGCSIDVDRVAVGPTVFGAVYEDLTAGWFHTCGLRANGTITCWGEDSVIEGGQSFSGMLDVPSGDDFRAVRSGLLGTCGIHEDDTLSCWGTGIDANFDIAEIETPEGEFTDVDPGYLHGCGLLTEGDVYCWIGDVSIQFDPADYLDDADTTGVESVKTHFARNDFEVAMHLDDGTVYNLELDFGAEEVADDDAVQIMDEDQYDLFDANVFSLCGFDSDGIDTRCFVGTVGDDPADEPIVEQKTNALEVDAGLAQGCALYEDGEVRCLGPEEADHPVNNWEYEIWERVLDVPDETFDRGVATGASHACAITEDDWVECWGTAITIDGESAVLSPTTPIQ